VKATATKLTSFIHSPSDRRIHIPDLPVFEDASEVDAVLQSRAIYHPALYGNSPALAYLTLQDSSLPSRRVDDCLRSLSSLPQAAEVIENMFSGDCDKLSELDSLCRIADTGKAIRIWIPAFLISLIKKVEGLEKNDRANADTVLSLLGKSKLYSGASWEAVVFCALFFRLLNSRFSAKRDVFAIFPVIPTPKFEIELHFPYEESVELIIASLKTFSTDGPTKVILSYPMPSSLKLYDLFLTVISPGLSAEIWGYQCKAGALPKLVPILDHSIVLRSHDMDATISSQAVESGWVVAQMEDRDAFLGPTFLPLRLLEKPVGM
jgi:hypothetical protein